MAEFILFDLDGTLTDPKEGITKCVAHALKHFGIEREPDDLISFIGPPLKEQFMEYMGTDEKNAEEAVRIYRERFAPIGIFENKIYDGVLQMLDHLKKRGKRMAIATSKPAIFARQIADKYGLTPYLEAVVGSELDGTNTNKANVIKIAMDSLGAAKENTIMVGDRMHDCIGARKNGIACIGVLYGYGSREELSQNGALKIAESIEELEKILCE
ncbi:MAG: HAD family hydrolase [Clostridia bacterium]|nr:HAD family hydrolase [Clostridia bacterium]